MTEVGEGSACTVDDGEQESTHLVASMGLIYLLRTGVTAVAKCDFAVYIKSLRLFHMLVYCRTAQIHTSVSRSFYASHRSRGYSIWNICKYVVAPWR